MTPLPQPLTKNKHILGELRDELTTGDWPPHAAFYSESTLRDRFGVTVPTIRIALRELINEGLIYSEQGRGTFIAPRVVKNQILIVGPYKKYLSGRDLGIQSFLSGFLGGHFHTSDDHYAPALLSGDVFREQLEDFRFHFPNVKAVLFFRDVDSVVASKTQLDALGIPYLFYGSSAFKPILVDIPGFYYDEAEIVDLALSYLENKYGKRIAFAGRTGVPALEQRRSNYLSWMKARGLPPLTISLGRMGTSQEEVHRTAFVACKTLKKVYDCVFCADDWVALAFHNVALRVASVDGKQFPMLGVNDYAICEIVYPTLSSIRIPLAEDSRYCLRYLTDQIEGRDSPIRGQSRVQLISRMTA